MDESHDQRQPESSSKNGGHFEYFFFLVIMSLKREGKYSFIRILGCAIVFGLTKLRFIYMLKQVLVHKMNIAEITAWQTPATNSGWVLVRTSLQLTGANQYYKTCRLKFFS